MLRRPSYSEAHCVAFPPWRFLHTDPRSPSVALPQHGYKRSDELSTAAEGREVMAGEGLLVPVSGKRCLQSAGLELLDTARIRQQSPNPLMRRPVCQRETAEAYQHTDGGGFTCNGSLIRGKMLHPGPPGDLWRDRGTGCRKACARHGAGSGSVTVRTRSRPLQVWPGLFRCAGLRREYTAKEWNHGASTLPDAPLNIMAVVSNGGDWLRR